MEAITRKDYLRRVLTPLWLRPERGLWYAHEAYLVRKYLGEKFAQPSLELGCMEGMPTFIMLGGEFGLSFDVFSEVNWSEDSMHWKSLKEDYYDTSNREPNHGVDIKKYPTDYFEVGLSWKKTHLDKAERLGIYHKLIEQDPNVPMTKLEDHYFRTIWAPNLYWIDNIELVLSELARVLAREGRLVTVLPTKIALEHSLYNFLDNTNSQWIKDLDRGRYSNIARQARHLSEWERIFKKTGWQINRHENFLPKLVFQVNDIGLRPMFPVFMNIYETLQQTAPDKLLEIKQQWIDTVYHFLSPLCEVEWMEKHNIGNIWNIFELKLT